MQSINEQSGVENFSNTKETRINLFEKQFLEQRLMQYGGNVTVAAQCSGMTRQNFQRLMKKHNIIAKEYRK